MTPQEFDSWLDQHAEDIDILDHRASGVRRVTLAQLDRETPGAGRVAREMFRARWLLDGWLPTLSSDLEAAMRARPGQQTYVGPCPLCRAEIEVAVRPGMRCPTCRGVLMEWSALRRSGD